MRFDFLDWVALIIMVVNIIGGFLCDDSRHAMAWIVVLLVYLRVGILQYELKVLNDDNKKHKEIKCHIL